MSSSLTKYYKVLNVTEGCSAGEIKKAYSELSKKWHPDKNDDKVKSTAMFKKISEAYTALSILNAPVTTVAIPVAKKNTTPVKPHTISASNILTNCDGTVINPLTNKKIALNGSVFNGLISKGYSYDSKNNKLIPVGSSKISSVVNSELSNNFNSMKIKDKNCISIKTDNVKYKITMSYPKHCGVK